MAEKEIHVGDKYIIEIGATYWSPNLGNKYFIKGFDSLVMTDIGLAKLKKYKEPPKEVPHSCEFCKHSTKSWDEMPCMICNKNDFQPKDMFEAKNGK